MLGRILESRTLKFLLHSDAVLDFNLNPFRWSIDYRELDVGHRSFRVDFLFIGLLIIIDDSA